MPTFTHFLGGFVVLDFASSVIAFLLYAWDKRAAKRRSRRVSEKTLHLIALFGGWPGALLAQTIFRHKTQKRAFRRIFWVTVVANAALTTLILCSIRS